MIDPARVPPPGLPGLDPRWSRLVQAPDFTGSLRTWHLLDTHADSGLGDPAPSITVICVHGNPTWSYLWRSLLAGAPRSMRVIAVDQLDMGFSERTGVPRRLADRVDDLCALTAELGITGPVVTVAHDWGGPISLGWALRHRDDLRGVVLLNTAVHQPAGSPAPSIIRVARWRPLLRLNTSWTDIFVRGTTRMSRSSLSARKMPSAVAEAFAAPYRSAARRRAIGDFVADIPLEQGHPSSAALESIADGIKGLDDTPALLLWGPNDPVFSDRYLADFMERLPHADVHRYERSAHLVIEDAPRLVADLLSWLAGRVEATPQPDESQPDPQSAARAPSSLLDALLVARDVRPGETALAEMSARGAGSRVTWQALGDRVERLAAGLRARGIETGDRVSVLIPPGADLIAVVYACWSIGASVVIADTGLGIGGIRRAIRGARPRHVIGVPAGLVLARTLAIPGQRISSRALARICEQGAARAVALERPDAETEAVVVFTSGATGPAKGVVYRHRQVAATVGLLRAHYRLTESDSLVAAFAPWAVLGPALGITSVIPAMDVTKPRTLTARALSDAVSSVNGTVLWASPAALANVITTQDRLSEPQRRAFTSVRLALFAGAPVPRASLVAASSLMPNAQIRTPYGMTEALPVADIELSGMPAPAKTHGVPVGYPVAGVDVEVAVLDASGRPSRVLEATHGVTGEIAVRAAHIRDHYDRLWATNRLASTNPGWHRTGDVGHLDPDGSLWIEGRLAHVIVTPTGVLTPVGPEQRAITLPFVEQAALVGVGPPGITTPVLVVVITPTTRRRTRSHLLDADRTEQLRQTTGVDLAAVLVRRDMPVDIRHNSKIDRSLLAAWAERVLAGAGG